MLNISCNAKLNLFLYVTGLDVLSKYHLIESIFIKLNLSDILHISRNNIVVCDSDIKDNIVLRAYDAVLDYLYKEGLRNKTFNYGVRIKIIKKIPVAAGLGGGSSNAAAVIKGLLKLWEIDISIDEILKIALAVGSDVSFFIQNNHCAFVGGIGNKLYGLKLGITLYLVIVTPDVKLLSKDSYKRFDMNNIDKKFESRFSDYSIDDIEYIKWHIYNGSNDLYDSSLKLCPIIEEVISILTKQEGCITSRMSGSGTTCFGIFQSIDTAKNAAVNIKAIHNKWFVYYEYKKI